MPATPHQLHTPPPQHTLPPLTHTHILYGTSLPSPHRASSLRSLTPSSHHTYIATIRTGDTHWGGTTSRIYLRIIGDIRAGPEIALETGSICNIGTIVEARTLNPGYGNSRSVNSNSNKNKNSEEIEEEKEEENEGFARGSVREFKWNSVHVGNVVRVCLNLDNEDYGESWKLDKLVIEDVTLGRSWMFKGSWLNREKGFRVKLEPDGPVAIGKNAARRVSKSVLNSDYHLVVPHPSIDQMVHMGRFNGGLNAIGMIDNDMSSQQNGCRGGVIRKLCFELQSYSKDNCHVYLSGASPMLGEWQSDHALRMQMFAGKDGAWRGVWRLELELDQQDYCDEFKYSYFILEEGTGNAWWEAGDKIRTLRLLDFVGRGSGFRVESKAQCVEFDQDTLYVLDRYTVEETPVKPKSFVGSASAGRTPSSRLSALRSYDPVRRQELKPKTPIRMMPLGDEPTMTPGDDESASQPLFPLSRNGHLSPPSPTIGEDSDENLDADPLRLAEENKELRQKIDGLRRLAVDRERKIAKLTAQKRHYRVRYSEASFASSRASSSGFSESFTSPDTPAAASPISDDTVETTELRESSEFGEEKAKDEDLTTLDSPEPSGGGKQPKDSPDGIKPSPSISSSFQMDVEKTGKDIKEILRLFVERYHSLQADLVRAQMDQNDIHERQLKELEGARLAADKRFHSEFTERRRLFNIVQELRGNIRVFCRVRPPKNGDAWAKAKSSSPVSLLDSSQRDENCRISLNKKVFEYDKVFSPEVSQKAVYEATAGVIQSVLDGYNVCVFAYGQTSSGKTYTMSGPEHDRGVNYRALSDLFEISRKRAEFSKQTITLSVLEIYNESIRDLFADPPTSKSPEKLEVRQDPTGGANAMHVPGLVEKQVSSVDETWDILETGLENRAAGSTNMNEHSSRSHLVISVKVVCESKNGDKSRGRLHLVDLAGSERVSRSQATGARMKEAQAINKSLATLGDVFMALLQKQSHVPYRNSKLTHLLRDSLGGDSKTLMFVNVSCDKEDESETLSSLSFAKRVSRVELGAAGKNRVSGAELRLADKERQVESLLQEKTELQERDRKRTAELEDIHTRMQVKENTITELKDIQKVQTRELERLKKVLQESQNKQLQITAPMFARSTPKAASGKKHGANPSPGVNMSCSFQERSSVSWTTPSGATKKVFSSRPPMPSFASSTASARHRSVRFEDQSQVTRSATHTGAFRAKENSENITLGAQQQKSTAALPQKFQVKTEEKRVVFAFGTRMEVDNAVAKTRTKRLIRPGMRPPQRVLSNYGKSSSQNQGQRPRRLATFGGV